MNKNDIQPLRKPQPRPINEHADWNLLNMNNYNHYINRKYPSLSTNNSAQSDKHLHNSRSNYELMARQQQSQIASNILSIEENQRFLGSKFIYNNNATSSFPNSLRQPTHEQICEIRQKIAFNEKELSNLGSIQTETKNLLNKNESIKQDFKSLENSYVQDGYTLRSAINKVDFLKNQLDLLYKRRACAANAAIAQQRCVNFTTGPNKPRIQSSKSSALNSVLQNNLANKDVNHSRRPQASVGPFQIKKSSLQNNSEAINSNNNNSSISSSPMHHNSLRESALSNPINYPKNQNFGDHNVMIKKTSHPYHLAEFQRLAETNNKKERSNNLSNSIVNDELRYRKGRADIITLRNDSLKAAKRRSWAQSEASENENILRILLEEQRKGKSHLTFTDLFPIKSTKKYSLKNTSIEETENAVHQTTTSDVNRKLDEEKSNLNSLNETIQKNPIHTPKTVKVTIHPVIESHDKEPIKYAESQINTDPPIEDLFVDDVNNIVKEYEEIKKDENNDKVLDNEILEYIELKETELKNSLTSEESSTDEESSLNEELPVFLEAAKELNQTIKPILKTSGKKNVHRNIVFDPFVLFLDGALEGQLDTVKENATKIADISMPNDEGITALHNAICACHYEIVKFLIDNHANVNAQDSDGWTPLHCAASCNNLIMVKMLVENGACIYAITLSDAETPAKKCEENEDGYVSCANYLELADKWAGIINNKIMYAIYSYDPQEEDELMFMEGDSLCVIDRNTSEKHWWECEHMESGKRGLVPVNYLSLYPVWKHLERNQFVKFEIPQLPPSDKDEASDSNESKEENIKL